MTFFDQIHAVGPALALYAGAGAVLSADLVQGRRATVWGFTVVAAVVALGWTLAQVIFGVEAGALGGAVRVDAFSIYLAFLIGKATRPPLPVEDFLGHSGSRAAEGSSARSLASVSAGLRGVRRPCR